MKAFFVTQVSLGKYRLTYGATNIEGSLDKLISILADQIKEECRDIPKDEAYRFELSNRALPPQALIHAVYELEGVTRAKQEFYEACQDFKSKPGADTLKMRYDAYERLLSSYIGLNLDNLWYAIGVTRPDRAA